MNKTLEDTQCIECVRLRALVIELRTACEEIFERRQIAPSSGKWLGSVSSEQMQAIYQGILHAKDITP